MSTVTRERTTPAAGFTLIELLVVVALIGTMVAVSLPAIARYIRNYRINGAANAVQGGLQQARLRAITGNVNYGTLFIVIDEDTFQIASEDLPSNAPAPIPFQPVSGGRLPVTQLLADPLRAVQTEPPQDLPVDVVFADGGNGCPDLTAQGFAFDGTEAVRFNRLGGACRPGPAGEPCPEVDTGRPSLWRNAVTNDLALCVREVRTGVMRGIVVSPGGRIAVAPPPGP